MAFWTRHSSSLARETCCGIIEEEYDLSHVKLVSRDKNVLIDGVRFFGDTYLLPNGKMVMAFYYDPTKIFPKGHRLNP